MVPSTWPPACNLAMAAGRGLSVQRARASGALGVLGTAVIGQAKGQPLELHRQAGVALSL